MAAHVPDLAGILPAVQNLTNLAKSFETAVGTGFPNCRIRVSECRPAGVVGFHCCISGSDTGVFASEPLPQRLRFAALEEYNFELWHQVDQPGQRVQPFRDLRAPQTAGLIVAVPRVGVPRGQVSRRQVHRGEQLALEGCGIVVVLHAQHSGAHGLVGHRPGITQNAQDPGLRAPMKRRDVRHPPPAGRRLRLPEGLDQLVHCSDVWKVHTGELLSFEGRVPHLFDHPWILAVVPSRSVVRCDVVIATS